MPVFCSVSRIGNRREGDHVSGDGICERTDRAAFKDEQSRLFNLSLPNAQTLDYYMCDLYLRNINVTLK